MEDQKWLKKPFNIQFCYTEIEELVKHHGPPLVVLNNLPVYKTSFLVELVKLAVKKGSEYALPPKQEECDKEHITEYNNGNMETVMLIIGLSCLSWLSFNIKRKTEEGHCRNPGHNLKDGHPYCSIGKVFHWKLYDDLLKILQDVIGSIRINTPQSAT
jgi:hypothetical protein